MKEIMNQNVVVGKINQTIYEIAEMMKKYDIGFLPIAKGNKIVGVITDRDIVIGPILNQIEGSTSIENYITHRVISIDINASIDDLLECMTTYQIKRILITDQNKIVGVISIRDLVAHNINSQKLIDTLKQIDCIKAYPNQSDLEIDEFYL